jgi:hypothetical protein
MSTMQPTTPEERSPEEIAFRRLVFRMRARRRVNPEDARVILGLLKEEPATRFQLIREREVAACRLAHETDKEIRL